MKTNWKNTTLMMIAALSLVAGVACQAPAPAPEPAAPPAPDYAAEMGPLTDTFIEVWNTGDYDKLDGILAADFRRVAPDQNADGVEAMKEFMGQVHTAYPDFNIVVTDSAFTEDGAFIHWTVTGTNTGEGATPPTGNTIEISGITLNRVANGKITHEIVYYDTATMMRQLGAEAVPHASQ